MQDALQRLLAAELAGWVGVPAESIPGGTRAALHRRGFIEVTPDGSRKLTALGRSAAARLGL